MEREEKEREERRRNEDKESKADSADSGWKKKVTDWIEKMENKQKEEEADKEKIRKLHTQIEEMTKGENRRPCHLTGVNMFAGLEAIQGEGATRIDLAAKAQAAMAAATSKRKREEDEESEGESLNQSLNIGAKTKLQSGLMVKTSHKIKYEVDWAHHWLGKEFEVEPFTFQSIKVRSLHNWGDRHTTALSQT